MSAMPVVNAVPAVCEAEPGLVGPLDVPRYSQMSHVGHSPEYGGGGEAWCSPTSTSMVLGYYDALPAPATYARASAAVSESGSGWPSMTRMRGMVVS